MDESKHSKLHCSFCGKDQREVGHFIAGPTLYICDECVVLCEEIIKEETKKKVARSAEAAVEPPPQPEPRSDEVATRRRELGALAFRLASGCFRESDLSGLPKILGVVAYAIANSLDPQSYDRIAT